MVTTEITLSGSLAKPGQGTSQAHQPEVGQTEGYERKFALRAKILKLGLEALASYWTVVPQYSRPPCYFGV